MPYFGKRQSITPSGFSDQKEDPNYFLDAIREMWSDLEIDTDTEEVRWILNWFDERRKKNARTPPS